MLRKIVFPLLTLGTAVYALPVAAQSSVTLFGIVDDSITYIHNVAGQSSRLCVQPGQASPR